jgi:cytochrome c553
MRQTSQISKLTSLRAGFAVLSIFALSESLLRLAIAADPAPMAAPMAEAKAAVPGKPKLDVAAGEALYTTGDTSKRGVVTACLTCHGPKGQSAVSTWPKLSAQHAAYTAKAVEEL